MMRTACRAYALTCATAAIRGSGLEIPGENPGRFGVGPSHENSRAREAGGGLQHQDPDQGGRLGRRARQCQDVDESFRRDRRRGGASAEGSGQGGRGRRRDQQWTKRRRSSRSPITASWRISTRRCPSSTPSSDGEPAHIGRATRRGDGFCAAISPNKTNPCSARLWRGSRQRDGGCETDPDSNPQRRPLGRILGARPPPQGLVRADRQRPNQGRARIARRFRVDLAEDDRDDRPAMDHG